MWQAPALWDGRDGFQNLPSWQHENQETGAKANPLRWVFTENSGGSDAPANNVFGGISLSALHRSAIICLLK